MQHTILTYLIIGVIVSFIVDLLQDHLTEKGLLDPEIKESWGWSERCICIILWPMAIIMFMKGIQNKNKNDE